MAMGGGRCGGLSVAGRLHGSSRSKSSDMGSSGDLSSRVYFEGGSVRNAKERPCNETQCLKKKQQWEQDMFSESKGDYKNKTELSHDQNHL